MEKTKEELNKINSSLNFYYREGTKISFEISLYKNIIVKGRITKKNFIGKKYVVLSADGKDDFKIFIEDITSNSIIPVSYEKKENKNKRVNLPNSLRYRILKRDRFTCSSCGARAPDVELEVDHIIPVSKGGTDEETNLVTKCFECNNGKSNKI